jgi:hypothetical protein
MRKLIIVTLMLSLAGPSASYARGGGGHGGGMGGMHMGGMHGGGMQQSLMQPSLMAPANPSVPPSLTPDPRLTGTAPLPPDRQPTSAGDPSAPDAMYQPTPDEIAVDRAIGSICRGC